MFFSMRERNGEFFIEHNQTILGDRSIAPSILHSLARFLISCWPAMPNRFTQACVINMCRWVHDMINVTHSIFFYYWPLHAPLLLFGWLISSCWMYPEGDKLCNRQSIQSWWTSLFVIYWRIVENGCSKPPCSLCMVLSKVNTTSLLTVTASYLGHGHQWSTGRASQFRFDRTSEGYVCSHSATSCEK